ncbi:MAG: hypothetical protein U0324_00855 [Polyangiales bacterium]
MKRFGMAFCMCAMMLGCGAAEGDGASPDDAAVDAGNGAATSVQALITCPRVKVRPATCRDWVCERVNGCVICACRDL